MKIFFSASIRAGGDRAAHRRVARLLSKFGTVYGEHGSEDSAHVSLTDSDSYLRDISWIDAADMLVAEVSTTSFGVGYEVGRAVALGKAVICIWRKGSGSRLSAMVTGNKSVKTIVYTALDDLDQSLRGILKIS